MNKLTMLMTVLLSSLLMASVTFAGQNTVFSPANFFYGYTIDNANRPVESTVKSNSTSDSDLKANFEMMLPAHFFGYVNPVIENPGRVTASASSEQKSKRMYIANNVMAPENFFGYKN